MGSVVGLHHGADGRGAILDHPSKVIASLLKDLSYSGAFGALAIFYLSWKRMLRVM